MMRKKCLLLCMVALCLSLIATSCSKNDSVSQGEIAENFKALVMGGKDIDPNHTWSTATTTPITVSVDLDAGTTYSVYFFLSNPTTGAEIKYAGMGTLESGETKVIYVTKPVGTTQYYAACYNDAGYSICLPVNGTEINFSGNISIGPDTPSPTTGNNWSVPSMNMPNVSKYNSGNLIEVTDVDPEFAEDAETHIKISSDFTGFLPYLNNHTNLSVYVTGTWTMTFDQRFINGNVLVVGNGGKVIIPSGFKLSNGSIDGTLAKNGTIIVMPGGEITGEGTLESVSESANDFYNGGTISSSEIHLEGATLYNAGTVGTGSTTITGEANASGNSGQFINFSTASLSQTNGSALGILNAGNMKVVNTLTISSASRMDDNSTIECGLLSLQGDGSSNTVLQMGNSAYLNCSGSISINNFGVWGPSGNNYKSNAIIRVGNCNQCTTTAGNANTFLLDHVQLMLASNFQGFEQIAGWINGSGISTDRQTCFFGLDNTTLSRNCIIYAFEFPGDNSIRDFDYNDLILSVGIPQDNGDGTFTSAINVSAIGSTMTIHVLYKGEEFGPEVHEAMGISKTSTINTSSFTRSARRLGDLTFNSSDNVDLSNLPFSIRTEKSDGSNSQVFTQQGNQEAPLFLAINGDENGKWYWPREGSNIGLAYLLFSTWANNQQSAINWYNSANASSTQIISW